MSERMEIATYILAGGKSSRMGTDKGLIPLKGKPFVQWILEATAPLTTKTTLVTSNTAYDQFSVDRIEDQYKESGPLGGIHSALSHTTTQWNLIVSCDAPLVTTALFNHLIQHHNPEHEVTFAALNGKAMPLIGIYHQHLNELAEKQLKTGKRKVMQFIEQTSFKAVELAGLFDHELQNINTPEELDEIKKL